MFWREKKFLVSPTPKGREKFPSFGGAGVVSRVCHAVSTSLPAMTALMETLTLLSLRCFSGSERRLLSGAEVSEAIQ